MDQNRSDRGRTILIAQFFLILTGIAIVALMPPASGAMIAWPLLQGQRSTGIDAMLAAGARIERAGPLPGSLVLNADRAAMLWPALDNGVLLFSTTLSGCTPSKVTA
jgi:hypothetical protein